MMTIEQGISPARLARMTDRNYELEALTSSFRVLVSMVDHSRQDCLFLDYSNSKTIA